MDTPEIPLESLDAARVAALLGEHFSLQVLVDVGVDLSGLDPLFDNGLLKEEAAGQARFEDFQVREGLLTQLPWSFRRRWSLKLAESLEKLKGEPAKLGELFLSAQDFDRARPYLIRAAESACMANEYAKALELLRQVFEIWHPDETSTSRSRLLREMARCAANSGDKEAVVIAWEELLENARIQKDIVLQIEAHQQLAEWAGKQGSRARVRDQLQAAAELSSELGDPDKEARHWFEYAGFLMTQVKLQAANVAFDNAYHAASNGEDTAQRIEILATRALGQAMAGNSELAFGWVDQALNEAIKHELPEQVSYVYRRMANVNEYSGNFQAYLELELKALDRCQASGGDEMMEHSCFSCLSYAFFRCGQWKRSQEMLQLVIDDLKLEGELKMIAVGTRAVISAFRGERKLAENNRKHFDELVRHHGGAYMQFHVYWGMGVLAYLDGDAQTAQQEFANLIDHWHDTEDRHDVVPGLTAACSFYADSNQPSLLAQCTDILNTVIADNNNVENRAAREAVLAEGAWVKGDVQKSIELAVSALDLYEEQKTPIEVAFISRRLGKMYQSMGDAKSAESAFQKGEGIARRLGMRPLLEAIRADRNANQKTDSSSSMAAPGLTKRQKEVLKLMADGQTNKEVAAELSLSPRTVEMHVGSILERLNCRARTDAIKKAVELGLV